MSIRDNNVPTDFVNILPIYFKTPLKHLQKQDYLRKSHESETVKRLYAEFLGDEFLGEPGSHKAHEVLHTSYVARPKYK